MLKRFLILLPAVLALCLAAGLARADSGICGDAVYWELDDSGVLTVWGSGEMTSHPWSRDGVKRAYIRDGVTHIAAHAFAYCSNLEYVEMADSVTIIGEYAFEDCTSLTDVRYSPYLATMLAHAFDGCTSYKAVTLPDSVQVFMYAFDPYPDRVFYQRPGTVAAISLSRLNFGFRSPGDNYDLQHILSWDDPDKLALYRVDKDAVSLVIPEGVYRINQKAAAGCGMLESVLLPETLVMIDFCAFQNCSSLREVVIPDSVTEICPQAFSGCSALERIVLSKNLGSVAGQVFKDCVSLKKIYIPDSVTLIGADAFQNCTSLEWVRFSDNITSIELMAFRGCSSLVCAALPESLEIMYSGVFMGCESLCSILLPADNVEFQSGTPFCAGDTTVFSHRSATARIYSINNGILWAPIPENILTLPESLTVIEEEAFAGLARADAVRIPSGVTVLSESMFSGSDLTLILSWDDPLIIWAKDRDFTVLAEP